MQNVSRKDAVFQVSLTAKLGLSQPFIAMHWQLNYEPGCIIYNRMRIHTPHYIKTSTWFLIWRLIPNYQ